ncbi:hypothetical protein [Bosea sp. (in: a-proteobacteria)]|uniref:hypothetical protein n=1 Tax=Bosea sp. (in: a-proteobacteria) TaxID=1871050 RepID=UPI001AD4A149|nr:hypothetical protein [Bosea sp. (in: a-proteobacteria)]MBN9435560.1 hypothetical protein [Bosea sp. (in: a-proteobacteria)]
MSSAILARIAKLEERRRPAVTMRSKAERDAEVAAELARLQASPEAMAAIMARLRGNEDGWRSGQAAIAAALRADT